MMVTTRTLWEALPHVNPLTSQFQTHTHPHWFRGSSYLKIGWKWVSYALNRCYALIASISLSSEPDPEPAMASIKQAQKRQQRFAFEYEEMA